MTDRGERTTPNPTVDGIKRRAYVVALAIAGAASLAEFTLSGASQPTGFRWLFGPGIVALCALLALNFGFGRLPLRALEKTVVAVSWTFIVVRAISVLAGAVDTGFAPGSTPNFGIWMSAGFIFTFVALRTRVALPTALFLYGVIVSCGVAFLVARGDDVRGHEINTLFQQLVVANGFTIAFVHYLARTKEELARERTERLLMSRLAHTDELTMLPNRRFILQSLQRAVTRADRESSSLSVILFDLDRFKVVNDTFGHATGDAVLRRAAMLASSSLRTSDELGRYGGEEFLIVAFDADLDAAAGLAERLRVGFEHHVAEGEPPFTASFGVASHRYGEPLTSLLSRADDALYSAKSRGRNRVVRDTEVGATNGPEGAPGTPI